MLGYLRQCSRRGLGDRVLPTTTALVEQRRLITRLYTSYYAGQLFPNQLVIPSQRRPRLSAGKGEGQPSSQMPQDITEAVSWEDAESTDIARIPEQASAVQRPQHPHVPLTEAAEMELQGDYLMEGGLYQDALEYYGVVAKVYELARPKHHGLPLGIRLKLVAAFRLTGRLESSLANAEKALALLDEADSPSLELVVEALMELGLTKEAMKSPDAAEAFEEAVTIAESYHDYGASHKMLRLLPRLGRRLQLNYEEKFLYYSPFDYDRTFALVDHCLERAEALHRAANDTVATIRVLQKRKEIVDKKYFNMRDFAGKIHTMRGHWMRRARTLTNAPTPDEVLRYSPTIHQVYRDFKYELNAPIGREKEVHPGVNRMVHDLGNPYRRRNQHGRDMSKNATRNFEAYIRAQEFND